MEYSLCIKENDSNLLHIIKTRDLPKVIGKDLVVLLAREGEEAAFKAVQELVTDFCKAKGKSPNFSEFKVWAKGARL